MSLTARAVVALRHDGELLGSIWAAVGGPPTAHRVEALRSAAPVIARRVVHARRVAGNAARGRDDQLERLLAGGETAVAAARKPALVGPLVVVAMRGEDPEAAVDLAGAPALHLSAVCPDAACALQGDTLFCVMGAGSGRRIVTDFLTRVPGSRGVVAGVGVTVPAADLPPSRAAAADVVRALLGRGEPGRCAELPDVFADVMVDRLRGFLSTYGEASPLTRLQAHDAKHETGLVEAIDGYLTASGNVLAAAAALHLHPNTIRNRVRRARESCGVDADDPATRLALMMHLRGGADALTRPPCGIAQGGGGNRGRDATIRPGEPAETCDHAHTRVPAARRRHRCRHGRPLDRPVPAA
ncbi:helix-turn-helix domain-containing protein [Nocardioides sp. B-3]|uniref:helix-turn-helix domain-containing protein n=1 Tax=Nocardioides sp. B-3 TaxID=2895565 RepID=UPI002152B9AF|nr:helix-turn-helix domain-containing protein [Nocardioides sp. B-3]UUZ59678.1 helix-turn-helix domain-containing protein [Nocardioides sp. B-3]